MPSPLTAAFTRHGSVSAPPAYFVDDSRGAAGFAGGTSIRHSSGLFNRTLDGAARALRGFAARRGAALAGGQTPDAWAARLPADQWLLEALARADAAGRLRGASAVVFGSTGGSDEALLLAAGAARVTIVEHQALAVEHAGVTVLTVAAARAAYCAAAAAGGGGAFGFDLALSNSAFDHDGLGRYGDAVSPDADLLAMDEVRCEFLRRRGPPAVAVRAVDARGGGAEDEGAAAEDEGAAAAEEAAAAAAPGNVTSSGGPAGLLILTVPIGPDAVVWNAMRRYGEVRLPLLLHGWRDVDRVGWEQRRLTADAPLRGKSYEPALLLEPEDTDDADAAAECAAVRRVHCHETAEPLEALLAVAAEAAPEPAAAAAAG